MKVPGSLIEKEKQIQVQEGQRSKLSRGNTEEGRVMEFP